MKKYNYVYKITNINPQDERKYYIGVRSCNCQPEEDNYWSSSKYLKESILVLGQSNFKKEILSIWNTREEAISEEIKLHNQYDVGVNPKFYNRSKQTSIGWDTTNIKVIHSPERNKKISDSLKGQKYSKERVEKARKALKEKYANGFEPVNKGKPMSEEQKKLISLNHADISGEKNPMTKEILVFNNDDELIHSVKMSFTKFCKIHNLPLNQLTISYKNNGLKLYPTEKGKKLAEKQGFDMYIGWYAKIA